MSRCRHFCWPPLYTPQSYSFLSRPSDGSKASRSVMRFRCDPRVFDRTREPGPVTHWTYEHGATFRDRAIALPTIGYSAFRVFDIEQPLHSLVDYNINRHNALYSISTSRLSCLLRAALLGAQL